MRRIISTIGLLALVAGAAVFVSAQPEPEQGPPPQAQPRTPRPSDDPLGDAIFPPEMIMQHQRELALTDEQKTFMRTEIQRTTMRFNELQWQLQDAMEALHEIMKGNSVDEAVALRQLDRVLNSEREIKRLHIELAIRIKNKLTPEQQMKLQTMRHEMMGPRPGGPGMGPGGPDGPGRMRERRPGGPGPGPGGPTPRPPDERLVP